MSSRFARLAAGIAVVGALGAASAATTAGASTHAGGAATTRAAATATKAAAARAALRGVYAAVPRGNNVRAATSEESDNWSGYADTGTGFSKSSSTWTQPKISCPTKELQLAAFWVGIDGWGNDTVEQDGTLAECYEGTAYYYTWWEMYPTNDIQTVGTTVKAGDKIAASVVRTGTSYALKVTDSTTSGNNVSETETCAASTCKDASDEVIGEAPSGSRGEYPLPDFAPWTAGSIVFATTTKTGDVSTFTPSYKITMEGSDDYALATPSALTSGDQFKDTWDNSY